MKPLYLDYNATTPILPRVFEAMRPFLTQHFGNPASSHMWGPPAREGLERARESLAALLGARAEEMVFTSSATESNNTVLKGLCPNRGDHLVISAIEHPATLESAAWLESRGVAVSRVGVDRQGLVDPERVLAALRPSTRLVSLMLANNETGAIQPVQEVARLARERGVAVHTDAAQAVGKIPVDVVDLGVDYLTVAGHKFYAPKGVGALYLRRGLSLPPLLHGGGQEAGRRSGTENIPHIAALGEAARLAGEDLPTETARQKELGHRLLAGLSRLGVDHLLPSAEAPRLPNTMCLGFAGLRAADIISGLVGLDVAVSAGAACHGENTTCSHVLTSMGAEPAYANGTIRVSWGRSTTLEDMDQFLQRLSQVLEQL